MSPKLEMIVREYEGTEDTARRLLASDGLRVRIEGGEVHRLGGQRPAGRLLDH